jgi:2-oxoisovalerate dehydrogenase E2 component (dihydrolipoyl transacylase)
LIKGLLLAMEEHPIMRSRVRSTKDKEGERWLEVARDGTIAVAVSGESFPIFISHPSSFLFTPRD